MTEGRLQVGDMAPDFQVMAAVDGKLVQVSLEGLLEGKRALVLTSYVLDFTGG
jgi:alkyl hydroperoxide reductase subunit AhpC